MASARLRHLRRERQSTNISQLVLQAELIERAHGQRSEYADALMQHAIGILESECDYGRRAHSRRWVRNAPVRGYRLTWPDRTCFGGSVITDGKDKIERWST